jgi:deoxycytidine triphosphate deaminase
VLTEKALEGLIDEKRVAISYHFDPLAKPPVELTSQDVNLESPDSKATQAFRSALFGDRFGLTVGPLVLSHTHSRARGRGGYKNFPNIFDLRESDNRISIKPGESITVNTIERVALDGSMGALILPRLTHATAGLTATPSYIDPYWDGLPVLHLVNVSRYPYQLEFGERIAACQFYRLEGGEIDETFRRRFMEKSHHYGLSWERIATSDADPFPMRKRPTKRVVVGDRVSALLHNVNTRLAAGGLTLVSVAAALIAYGHFEGQVGRVDELSNAIHHVTSGPFANGKVGQVNALIPAGARTTLTKVHVTGIAPGTIVLTESRTGGPDLAVSGTVVPNSSGVGALLEITATRLRSGPTEEVVVQWLAV